MKNSKILTILIIPIAILTIGIIISNKTKMIVKPTVKSTFPVPANAIDEIKLLRTETSRTFVNKNGSYTNVSYQRPINYKDENGELKEISTLITPSTLAGYDYEVTTNSVKTYFKKTLNENDYLLIIDGNKKIIQGISENQEGLGKIKFSTAMVVDNKITYPNIYPGIDLRYTVYDYKVLEEFIVNDNKLLSKIESFSQKLTLVNLNLKENDNQIIFDDNLGLPKPVMYELNNRENESYEINYRVNQLAKDQYLIDKIINNNGKLWLNDKERQLPLAIDATVVFSENAAGDDARSRDQGYSYFSNSEEPIKTGFEGTANVWLSTGFRFTPNIPRGSSISDAHLTLTVQTGGDGPQYYVAAENVDDCPTWAGSSGNAPGDRYVSNATGAVLQAYRYYNGGNASYDFNNISTSVGTVTSRAGWTTGNHLCVFLDWNAGATQVIYYNSFEDATASYRPTFSVTYTITAPSGLTASDGTEAGKIVLSWNRVVDVTNYNIYHSTDCSSAKSLLGTSSTGSYNDSSATAPVLAVPTLAATQGTDSTKVTLSVSNESVTQGTSRAYWVTAVDGSVESTYSNCNTGYMNASVDADGYYYDLTTNSSGSDYNTITTSGTDPYDWTGANLNVHYYFRVYYTATGGSTTLNSDWSTTTGGIEGWRDNPDATSNTQFDGVQIDGVQIAPP